MRHFPNYAGRDDVDDLLTAELETAGIEKVHNLRSLKEFCRSEVKTGIVGEHCGWSFKRAWYYWIAEGPGLPPTFADPLHAGHGRDVRVEGHCGRPSPLEYRRGFAISLYHVDTPEGLKALFAALSACAADGKARLAQSEKENRYG